MSYPTRAQIIAGRKAWMPRMRELPAQCASCPFTDGNDAEFAAVVARLDGSPAVARFARLKIRQECSLSGEFACHGTVYDQAMRVRPRSAHRQCPGASAHYRSGKPATLSE
jgi:hypothetical protein